eukprot:scaffold2900_cov330-Prasinococcus_capsulatus_cf.AAC.6
MEGRIIVRHITVAPGHEWQKAEVVVFSFVTQGFDEYMNLVLEDAEEVSMKKGTRKELGTRTCRSTAACTNDL